MNGIRKPLLLDLFSGAGGAGVGYSRAGFEVVGVDLAAQPSYPFQFIQAEALRFLRSRIVNEFEVIHASPPCQDYSALKALHGNEWPRLIGPVRVELDRIGKPYVIENVPGAPLRHDVMLCGEMFGLAVIRHRYFELGGWAIPNPSHPRHRGRVAGFRHGTWFEGPYFAVHGDGGGKGSLEDWRAAMGVEWMRNRREVAESVPPAYTEWIGTRLLTAL